ncbi:MAG TPA: cation diffusion facilitator family transporter [Actinomycetota bacterium]|nr:cation diffusion facilitator family transporter [Actinomycetota bacterium]
MSGSHGVAAVAGPEGTKIGLRAIRLTAGVLALAATAQLLIVGLGGSAGLFAAALDNIGDVISTVALALAFAAARRAADDRYTFGYQRLEDLAGIVVVMVIWASAGLAAFESIRKLSGSHRPTHLIAGLIVAGIGALANEVVARYKMRVGRAIGSQPLIADGRHARIDALASIAAFAGLLGVKLGWRAADPLAGLLITVAIMAIAWDASRHVLARVMDAVDPSTVSMIEHAARETPGVAGVGRIQARWVGRSLYVTLTVAVDGDVPVNDAHGIADAVHHHIIHDLPGVAQVDVHVDPWEAHAQEAHRATSEHPPVTRDEHGHYH